MNWYKKANREDFQAWLAKELPLQMSIPNPLRPHSSQVHNIQLIEDWVNETDPSLEGMNFAAAVYNARKYYQNKEVPSSLTPEDIDKDNLIDSLIDEQIKMGIYPLSIYDVVIGEIRPATGEKGYIVEAKYHMKYKNDMNELKSSFAMSYPVTTDGKHFSFDFPF